jgi:hypothetical protein
MGDGLWVGWEGLPRGCRDSSALQAVVSLMMLVEGERASGDRLG